MARLYGKEQREKAKKIREELIKSLDSIYLKTFEELNDSGLGEGMIIKLTQLLLLSKDAAIIPLKKEVEAGKTSPTNNQTIPN